MRKVAWVTGGNRGMGANTAIQLAKAGYDVAITARDDRLLNHVAEQIEALGVSAFPLASDLTDRQSVEAFAAAALDRFGRCDVLCNIGVYQGPGVQDLFLEMPLDGFTKSLVGGVIAPAILCQRAIPSMIANGGGVIVNMSSLSVVLEPTGSVKNNGWGIGYVAAKAGIDRFAGVLNIELGASGIRAFNVEPGFVAYGEKLTEYLTKYPESSVSPPEAIGPAIVWLIENPQANSLLNKRVNLPTLTLKHGLLDGWDGPGTAYKAAIT